MGNDHAIAFADPHPITDGHMLVTPRKHVASFYELNRLEQEAVWQLVGQVRQRLLTGLAPHAFSIGFTDVEGAEEDGHVCVHVVPRRGNAAVNLRDGIDWVTDDRPHDFVK